jgi:CelD/BcsL family acetyltransferase involved in cellulose biosynthesis
MQIEIIHPSEIDDGLATAWRALQASDPDLGGPFFTPDFARIVGQVRPDARVAVLRDGPDVSGVFTYHRQRFGRLAPLAGQISDYHGLVARPGHHIDMRAILRAAEAQAFDFNHVPRSQAGFVPHAYRDTTSPLVDLRDGFDAWFADKSAQNRSFRDLARRTRKLERQHGPVRLVANDTSRATWDTFMDWKRAALAAAGAGYILDTGWAGDIARAIRDTDTPEFGGMTSALWAGDTLVAVHFGMRSARRLHWWFPSYSRAHAKMSPGLIQIVEMLHHLDAQGFEELDFGRGEQRYKRDFMNAERPLLEGSLERPASLLGIPRRLRKGLQAAANRLPSPKVPEFTRRAGDRLLGAGRLT